MNPRRLEMVFQWVMVLGIIALLQPWNLFSTATASRSS